MKYIYSAEKNAFFPVGLRDAYESTNSWPEDGVDADEQLFAEFTSPKEGKMRVPGPDGLPAWADIPPPTTEQLLEYVERERAQLLAYADNVTADWRTELALGDISDTDKAKLSLWMAYKRDVKAVNAADAILNNFLWPARPE